MATNKSWIDHLAVSTVEDIWGNWLTQRVRIQIIVWKTRLASEISVNHWSLSTEVLNRSNQSANTWAVQVISWHTSSTAWTSWVGLSAVTDWDNSTNTWRVQIVSRLASGASEDVAWIYSSVWTIEIAWRNLVALVGRANIVSRQTRVASKRASRPGSVSTVQVQ